MGKKRRRDGHTAGSGPRAAPRYWIEDAPELLLPGGTAGWARGGEEDTTLAGPPLSHELEALPAPTGADNNNHHHHNKNIMRIWITRAELTDHHHRTLLAATTTTSVPPEELLVPSNTNNNKDRPVVVDEKKKVMTITSPNKNMTSDSSSFLLPKKKRKRQAEIEASTAHLSDPTDSGSMARPPPEAPKDPSFHSSIPTDSPPNSSPAGPVPVPDTGSEPLTGWPPNGHKVEDKEPDPDPPERPEDDIHEEDEEEEEPSIFVQRDKRPESKTSTTTTLSASPLPGRRGSFRNLPGGDCGDGIRNPYPPDQVPHKYWAQRHRLFTWFDQGIQLDQESWFSVTPEAIARHLAHRLCDRAANAMAAREDSSVPAGGSSDTINESSDSTGNTPVAPLSDSTPQLVVLDAFGGVGGNTVAFARHGRVQLVICVELDASRLEMAAHNSKIYQVPDDRVVFIQGSAQDVLAQYCQGQRLPRSISSSTSLSAAPEQRMHGYRRGGLELLPERLDVIFFSPPWGGVDYRNLGPRQFDLTGIQCGHYNGRISNGVDILRMGRQALSSGPCKLAYYLPRNTNGLALARSAYQCGFRGRLEMEQQVLNGKLKTITAYFDIP